MRPMATAEPVRSLPASTLTRLMCCYIREKMYILRLCAQSDTFKVLNHRVYTCHMNEHFLCTSSLKRTEICITIKFLLKILHYNNL